MLPVLERVGAVWVIPLDGLGGVRCCVPRAKVGYVFPMQSPPMPRPCPACCAAAACAGDCAEDQALLRQHDAVSAGSTNCSACWSGAAQCTACWFPACVRCLPCRDLPLHLLVWQLCQPHPQAAFLPTCLPACLLLQVRGADLSLHLPAVRTGGAAPGGCMAAAVCCLL